VQGRKVTAALAALALMATLSACGKREAAGGAAASPLGRMAQAVNTAKFVPKGAAQAKAEAKPAADGYDPVILKLQVLLDRARFSPGAIDGRMGPNLERALRAFQAANGLEGDGVLNAATWNLLTKADPRPVLRTYIIDADDVAGPFTPRIPHDLAAMARLDMLGYQNPAEEVAESFHMDPALLHALNPGADLRAGSTILVASRGGDDLGEDVGRVEIDRAEGIVRAYGLGGRLVAAYPATVGSRRRPAPVGTLLVDAVAGAPSYDYQDDEVSQAGAQRASTEIAAGPNNPVGVVWIGLNDKDRGDKAYGVQGCADPTQVGAPTERGWVQLTNWDARELARGVRKGVPIVFK